MNPFSDQRPEIMRLVDAYLADDEGTEARRKELADLTGVTEEEIDCWKAGKSRPDGIQLRFALNLLRSRLA